MSYDILIIPKLFHKFLKATFALRTVSWANFLCHSVEPSINSPLADLHLFYMIDHVIEQSLILFWKPWTSIDLFNGNNDIVVVDFDDCIVSYEQVRVSLWNRILV